MVSSRNNDTNKLKSSDPAKLDQKQQAHPKSGVDFTRYTSSTWKGNDNVHDLRAGLLLDIPRYVYLSICPGLSVPQDSTKSSKSVTFTSPSVDIPVDADGIPIEKTGEASATGMLIEEAIQDSEGWFK